MSWKHAPKRALHSLRVSAVTLAMLQIVLGDALEAQQAQRPTQTPIKHVIIIVGENRTFDHLFATYQPKNGQTVDNLLSRGSSKRMARQDHSTFSRHNRPRTSR